MDGRFDVTRNGLTLGVVELLQTGSMLNLSFVGNAPDQNNVYRLAAVCDGQYVLLGVPVPDNGGALVLKKSLSKTAIRELGFALPTAFELVLPGESFGEVRVNVSVESKKATEIIAAPTQPAMTEPIAVPVMQPVIEPAIIKPEQGSWRLAPNPSVMFAENGALSSADEITGALIRENGEIIELAIPVSDDEPFPIMSAFCLGEPQTINGGEYLVFKLKNGAFTV